MAIRLVLSDQVTYSHLVLNCPVWPDRLGAKCYLFFSEGAVFILVAIMPYAEKAVGLCKTTCFLP